MQTDRTGSGEPLALVGGGLTGWASWVPHQQRLAATRDVARFQLLSVQLGLEDIELPSDYSVRFESNALAEALDQLGWAEPIDLVAWSFGALVSLDFALGNPERIRTLTLIEPPALWVLPNHGQDDPEIRQLSVLLRSMTGNISEEQLAQHSKAVGLVPPGAEPQSLPQWPIWVRHRQSLRNCVAPLEHRGNLTQLESFQRPVLLVAGTGTAGFLRQITDVLADRFPDSRVVEMPAGHAPQLVSMERFLTELADFHGNPGQH